MNKMWLSVLLVPYMGFAQDSEELDSSGKALVLESQEIVESENDSKNGHEKEVACGQKTAPILSEEVKKQYQQEPAFCAYCGSSLIAKQEKEAVSQQEDSKEVAVSEQKQLTLKREPSSAGTKSLAQPNKNSDRPRVTQRKKEEGSSLESSLVGSQPEKNRVESQNNSQIVDDKRSEQTSSSEVAAPEKERSNSPVAKSQPRSKSIEDRASLQAEKKIDSKNLNRPKVTQRKSVSVAKEAAVQESVIAQKPRSQRFAEKSKKESTLAQKRPCAKQGKTLHKKRVIVKKSSQGSKARIKESMSSNSSEKME